MSNKVESNVKTLVYTIVYAVEASTSLTTDVDVIDHLREFGMAEIVDVKVVNKPLEKITVEDAK